MKFGIGVFPGTWSDRDWVHCIDMAGHEPVRLWHRDSDIGRVDAIVLPGGFSYGDHLRAGAIARFSPLMQAVADFAGRGGPVLGSCNGFQILCEAHLLPGALTRNAHLEFRCEPAWLRIESSASPWTAGIDEGAVLAIPVSHGEGRYVCDDITLNLLEAEGRVVMRYVAGDGGPVGDRTPNGSLGDIAGVLNADGNVLGMMPHPERACEPLHGGVDGMLLVESVVGALARHGTPAALAE